jgi:hypothetical protein
MGNGTKKQRDRGTMDNRTVDHGAMDNGKLGQWKWENRPRGHCNGAMAFGEIGTMGKAAMGQ